MTVFVVFVLAENGLPHPVDVLGALVLSLFEVDVLEHFLPACMRGELLGPIDEFPLILHIQLLPVLEFLLLLGEESLQLFPSRGFPRLLILILLVLKIIKKYTLFYLSTSFMRFYYSKILCVT